MRILFNITKWTSVCFLITACLRPVFASGITPSVYPAPVSNRDALFQIGACEIVVLDACFWFDTVEEHRK